MKKSNPFTITFGKQPNQFISRYEDSNRIIDTFSADNPVSQTFMIEGLRGSGKTVLMTAVAKTLGGQNDWIVINLNPTMNLLSNFAIRLESETTPKPQLISNGFNISDAGFGIGINGDEKSTDYVGIIDKCFKKIISKKKNVLITIDEVLHDENMKVFASQFQIFVRQDYPVFLIMTGLHENISGIQNDPSLTFLLRSPKITTGPLSIIQMIRRYREIFEIDEEQAKTLALSTKGYAFAFQALGMSYWEKRNNMSEVVDMYDDLLDDFVYKKIWSSLSSKERDIIRFIKEEETKTSDICKGTGMSNSTFSKYREKLISEGLILSPKYGYVSLTLPRFYEITSKYTG